MDFDWMNVELPQDIIERNAEHRADMARNDVRVHASLLRRLGHDAAYAKHRLLGNQGWAAELIPDSAVLTAEQVREQIAKAYAR